jgi:hypothetical protein
MTAREAARPAVLIVAAALPPLVVVARGPATRTGFVLALAAAATAAGLLMTERMLRRAGLGPVSVATAVALLYGTALVWHEAVAPGPETLSFLAGALAVRRFREALGGTRREALARGAALGGVLLALALAPELFSGAWPRLGEPLLLESLFSSRHGLFFWTPLLTVAALGLLARAWAGHRDGLAAAAALGVFALGNALLHPWWSGGMANARFLPTLPLFALGLATLLALVAETALRRPLRVLASAGAALVAWNLLLMAQYRAETIPRDDTVAFPVVAENSARLLAGAAGSPTAWPANWIFAARYRLPAGRYDLLAGQDVLASPSAAVDVGHLATDAGVLAEGWSVRHPCGGAICREVEGRARLLLPVRDPVAAVLAVRAHGRGRLRVAINGRALVEAPLGELFAVVGGRVERDSLRRGPNEVVLETSAGGRALVDAVSLTPTDDAP